MFVNLYRIHFVAVITAIHKHLIITNLLQAHIGIKGIVYDSVTKQGISNAIIHVQNITGGRMQEIQHDITSGRNFLKIFILLNRIIFKFAITVVLIFICHCQLQIIYFNKSIY